MTAADPTNGRIDIKKFNEETAAGEESFDTESLGSREEEESYDPTILSREEASWSLNLQALGINADSPVSSQIFLSGMGSYSDYGHVSVEPGSDPSAPEYRGDHSAYEDKGDEPCIPFHPKCFEIFQRVIAFRRGSQLKVKPLPGGEWDLNTSCVDLDKDLLWEVFVEHIQDNSTLDISYGDPPPPQDQHWNVNSGDEFFIADPGKRNDLVVNTIHDIWHTMDYQDNTAPVKQPSDLFAELPLELLLIITSALEPGELLNLLQASAHVRRGLGRDTSFWIQQFQVEMPWFYEIHAFLHGLARQTGYDALGTTASDNATGLFGKSLSHFFAWAFYTTTPRCGLKGSFMGIANRRRIWEVCKQVVDPYLARIQARSQPGDTNTELEEEAKFRNQMVCLEMPVVTSSLVTSREPEQFHSERVFWVRTWSELNGWKGDFTLNVFLRSNCLMGLELKMDSNKDFKRRLFGHDENSEREEEFQVSKKSMRISSGDRIIGFILHCPNTYLDDPLREEWCEKEVTGITVLCSSGSKETFGKVEPTNIKRPLLASEGMTIVGLVGIYELEKERFTRLGLYQVPTPSINSSDHLEMGVPAQNSTEPSWAESTTWGNDCTGIFTAEFLGSTSMDTLPAPFPRAQSCSGVPIWDVPKLHIQELKTGAVSRSNSDDLAVYEPLIWAKDVEEAHALRRITGYVRDGNIANGLENGKTRERHVHRLCGAWAEFAPESALERRRVGMVELYEPRDWQSESFLDFDIDGSGGEMITAVAVAMEQGSPEAVKLTTNRGREAYWGKTDKAEESWSVLTAPEGEMLIGIVVAFFGPSVPDEEIPYYLQCRMSYLATLSLPIK